MKDGHGKDALSHLHIWQSPIIRNGLSCVNRSMASLRSGSARGKICASQWRCYNSRPGCGSRVGFSVVLLKFVITIPAPTLNKFIMSGASHTNFISGPSSTIGSSLQAWIQIWIPLVRGFLKSFYRVIHSKCIF